MPERNRHLPNGRMGSHTSSFDLFSLPLEIRQHVYSFMAVLPRQYHLNALCTCRKQHAEVLESFQSRTVHLASQEQLTRYVARSQPTLRHVEDLHVTLTDMEKDLMGSFLAQIVMGIPKMTFQHPYELESTRITSSLKAIPNIRCLSLLESKNAYDSPAPSALLNQVLAGITRLYPQLRHLRVDSPNISLEPLASCSRLRTIRITGYSQTPAAAIALVFKGMPELVGLHIVSRRRQSRYFRCQDLKKSVNSTTVRHMRPLQKISIHDVADVHSNRQAFLTVNMLESLRDTHGTSLRQFCVSCMIPLERPLLVQLAETISAMTQVHTLILTWPGLEAELLQALPSTIWSLELLVSGQDHAAAMLAVFFAMRQRIPRLRKIKFVVLDPLTQSDVHDFLHDNPRGPAADSLVQESELGRPWAVTWGVWCPFPEE